MAEKLIPGIPIPTRISILQQTSTDETNSGSTNEGTSQSKAISTSASQLSVLEEVIDRATSRNEIQREIDGKFYLFEFQVHVTDIDGIVLSKAIDGHDNAFAPLRALRKVKHDRLKKELFEHDKDARLRSGTRGMAARKAFDCIRENCSRVGRAVGTLRYGYSVVDKLIYGTGLNRKMKISAKIHWQWKHKLPVTFS